MAVEMTSGLYSAKGVALNISEGGIACVLERPVPVRRPVSIRITDWELGLKTDLEARVIRSTMDSDGRHWVSVRFSKPSAKIRSNLVQHTFTSPGTWFGYHISVPPLKSLGKLISSPMRWLKAKELADRRVAPRFAFKTPCVLVDDGNQHKPLAGVGQLVEMSETGAAINLPNKYAKLPLMRPFTMRFEWPRNDFGREVIAVEMMVVRRLGKNSKGTSYAVAFPELSDMELAALQTYLYHPITLEKESMAVQKPKQTADFMRRHWVLTVQSKWEGVRFIKGESDTESWKQPGVKIREVPFGLPVEKVSLLRGNVVPLRRKDGEKP